MKYILPGLVCLLVLCQGKMSNGSVQDQRSQSQNFWIDSNATSISSRYLCPDSFYRQAWDTNSFEYYLSNLPLKPVGARVQLYNGTYKSQEVYSSVVDMEISPVDLQQCADAVMRLRGEYLYRTRQYGKLAFRFTGDGKMHSYLEYAGNDRSYKKFRKYMDYVFSYANTSSLFKQLRKVNFSDMHIGDVLIQTGNPYGHAVIVVDLCRNVKGEKRYLLAQSYMPAQETQILRNPGHESSWYDHQSGAKIYTPEWTFDTTDLRRW